MTSIQRSARVPRTPLTSLSSLLFIVLVLNAAVALMCLPLSTMAATETIDCNIGGFDLPSIPVAQIKGVTVQGDKATSDWVFSLCVNKKTINQQGETDVTYELTKTELSNGYPKLTYYRAATQATLTITLSCSASSLLEFVPNANPQIKKSGSMYTSSMLSTVTCTIPPTPKNGGGGVGGLIFVIVVFASLAVYIIAMLAWNFFKYNKRGIELIPHLEFWADFPFLLRDGAVFLFDKIKSLFGGRNVTTYEAV